MKHADHYQTGLASFHSDQHHNGSYASYNYNEVLQKDSLELSTAKENANRLMT